MGHAQVSIRTADGECPAHVFTPEGEGPWPAAIFYMDAFAIRPALLSMAETLAGGGYVVLLPDMFYRLGAYKPPVPAEVFASGDVRAALGPYFASIDNKRGAEDTAAFLDYLQSRPDVTPGKVGVTGYCMGGALAISAAGTHPDRIAATASFHAGGLVTDSPMSPHLFAPKIKGRVYVAGADKDAFYPPEMAETFDKVLTEAGVDHRCEIYDGALHGWTMRDLPVFNAEADRRHWNELFGLFKATLA